jgi:hypothetical protein
MSSEHDPRLPCAICGTPLAGQTEKGCVAMTAHLERMVISKLVVVCRAPCLEQHASDGATILCDEDLESYLGDEGAAARARLVATFGWTSSAAREYMDFARSARSAGQSARARAAAARMAS